MPLSSSLLDLPHQRARALLDTGVPVYLCVNPVEYHGPHLSLHNDALISAGLARELQARLAVRHPDWPLVTAGELEIGVDPTRGIGTRYTPYVEACAIVREACRALAELGARRVILLTFHGSPLHNLAIHAGEAVLRAHGVAAVAPFHEVMRALLDVDAPRFAEAVAHVDDATERAALLDGLHFDFHAGFFETSVALHLAPDTVSDAYRTLPPCPTFAPSPGFLRASKLARVAGAKTLADELQLAALGTAWSQLDPFPGYTGSPHRATAEAGAVFTRFILDAFETSVEDVFAGRAPPPEPIMKWTAPLTVNGRFAPKYGSPPES